MEDRIDLIAEQEESSWRGGVSWPVLGSVVVHVALIVWLIYSYHPVQSGDAAPPIAHYVELIRQNPKEFTEAPGPKTKSAPINAPYSDANRKASTPNPTGETPTLRPGDGSRAMYMPRTQAGDGNRSAPAQAPQQAQAAQQQSPADAAAAQQQPQPRSGLTFRQPTQQAAAVDPNGRVDWRNAIREVGKVASLGGRQGLDIGQLGGEKGTAEAGPLSFETQWYDWGEYAESMVSKIRVHWYEEMPMPLLQTVLKGVVTIRFLIHRDGTISDITIVTSSGIAPYDYAAKKAIELASPLKPLPADFPNKSEHVTVMFYYNSEPPRR